MEKLEENDHLEDQRMRGEDNMKIRMRTGYIWLRIWANGGRLSFIDGGEYLGHRCDWYL